MKKTETKEEKATIGVKLAPINIAFMSVKIVGKSDLLMDRMSDEIKDQILQKQTGALKSNKKIRDPNNEVKEAKHITSKGVIGFPASGFKNAMINAATFVGDKAFSKKLICGSIRIMNSDEGLIPIKFKKEKVLKHSIAANTKFNPVFEDWSCTLEIKYDQNNISAVDIMTLLNYAGFYIGVGSWRPKCRDTGSGEYGQFEVSNGV